MLLNTAFRDEMLTGIVILLQVLATAVAARRANMDKEGAIVLQKSE